ncbi:MULTISPECIES: MFS transporter [Pseudomonas]|jgi:MFS family permease|uniref:MFS transporter n=1 Tax=Pseudomonas TaxID=286 RepID=UPI00041DFE27|nr:MULTISPECIES: MFS transporter [Pseudomonas]MBB3270392.1 MFS family permease [Pseudomonas sp. OG7]MBH3394331.1 MFS transporter [Pseudomonas monteilii]NBB07608.1 MFS transporter [Pseudomonas monteilii]PXX61207.1 Na+/melibiose symporter-like transporter [Pseudomonas sp. LAIL14HWK12:I1]SNB85578.1 Na+/melibiose symporter [Pseudomonas sp. URIL14HWK12:I8]
MQALSLNSGTRSLTLGYCFSKCGEFAFEAAFAVTIVLMVEADLLLIGIAYFFRYLPSMVFSPLGGWLADNADKKRTLFAVELAKCILSLAFFALFSWFTPVLPVLVAFAMVMTALECLYVPTFRAYFPDIVEKDQLASVNSGIQVIEDTASIIGPLVFSACVLLLSRDATFLFFAICLVLSAISIATLGPARQGVRQAFDGRAIVRDAVRSVNQLKGSNVPLFAVIGCTTLCAMFATSVIRFILPASVLEHFTSEAAVGYVFSLLAAGTVLGGVLYTRFNPRTTARLVLRYWIIYGALFFAAAVALQFNTWLFLLILFLVGFIGAFVDIAIVTNIQCLSNEHEVGRNFSLYYFTAVIGDAVSGLVASLVFVLAGPATFIWMTLMLFIAPVRWNLKGRALDTDDSA